MLTVSQATSVIAAVIGRIGQAVTDYEIMAANRTITRMLNRGQIGKETARKLRPEIEDAQFAHEMNRADNRRDTFR